MTSALIRFRVRRETYTFHCNPPQIRWPFAGIDIYMPNTRWYCAAHLFMVSKQFEWPILNGFLFSWLTLLGCVYRVALCSRLINNKNRLRSSTPHTERLTWGVFWDNSIASATTVFFFDLWFFFSNCFDWDPGSYRWDKVGYWNITPYMRRISGLGRHSKLRLRSTRSAQCSTYWSSSR